MIGWRINMEFHEKLQELRKSKGITQEELAEALYVSRTAISKWESGRGYPSIDSLKEISTFFSVSIDDLLSGERLLVIAEEENKSNVRRICEFIFGMVDIFSFGLIALPLYPKTIDEHIYSVNLFAYTEANSVQCMVRWGLFISLIMIGIVKILLVKFKSIKGHRITTDISIGLGIATVLFLAVTREVYAIIFAFLLLVVKGMLLLKFMR